MASRPDNLAFIDESLRVPGAKTGPLEGLTVAIKDLFDVSCWAWQVSGAVAHCQGGQSCDLNQPLHRWQIILQALATPPGWPLTPSQLSMPDVFR